MPIRTKYGDSVSPPQTAKTLETLTMYNLFVSESRDAWEGETFDLDLDRCVREYTDKEITKRYGSLTKENVNELRRFPCIFAYETGCRKEPKFGVIRDVTERWGRVRVEYEIKEMDEFLTREDLNTNLSFELDIAKWEMNRTHWAVKDIDLARELHPKGIILPYWARAATKAVDITEHQFDVALSFPGEVRDYVETVAAELERYVGPNSYFYDNNYVSQLARPSFDSLLQDIYRNRSKLIVVFLCSDYQDKEWCGIEFRAVKEIMMERGHDKIMFVKMDDGQVDGVLKTDGYVDGRKFEPAQVAQFIQQRLDVLGNDTSKASRPAGGSAGG